jgi:mono/diheme cytochrome c family protein
MVAGGAVAQDAADGAALYGANCAVCHGAKGEGYKDIISALAENPSLENPSLLVTYVHLGHMGMPSFPWLTDDEVAAIASFLRGDFGNAYGPVTAEEVTAIRAELKPPGEVLTIWDGVFTQEQADRGQQVASGACASCHGAALNGVPDDPDMQAGPPLSGEAFLDEWAGRWGRSSATAT